ncbi:MAG TPA: endolytic transglycosylase MltG [Deltaproteobacteria bacterium]|nr:endolytic transglycosylase MltG [Deltaproteobacteria bacterium]
MNLKSCAYCLFIIITCICVLSLAHTYTFISTFTTPPDPVMLEIRSGTSAWEISKALKERGIITDSFMFMALCVATCKASHLQAGTYVFEGKHYPRDIMHILFKGRTLRYRITIPEGSNLFAIAEIVAATGLMTKENFIESSLHEKSPAFFGLASPSMEGFLYPDTYYLSPNMTALEIMARMVERFNQAYTDDMDRQAQALGMSKTEVVTLASIIEKEAVLNEEKPVISSVFHNRMKRNMLLQSDPTAIYGIDNFHRRISPKDLQRDTPYNTYKYRGLPPGPICNPDKYSLEAAIRPAKTNYLYFVSKGNGLHHFSSSLKEHNRAIMRNRKTRR